MIDRPESFLATKSRIIKSLHDFILTIDWGSIRFFDEHMLNMEV